jgi:histidinol dehydrogenase
MATYLKKASKKIEETQSNTRDIVQGILNQIRSHGESAVRELAAKFDNWTRDFILNKQEIEALIDMVPRRAKDDIRFAYDQVYGFAVKQRESIQAFETELLPGVTLGQRLVPCQCAGCYVPGGRFSHAASAIMSVATAKAAGVPFVVACTPPRGDSINPTVAYAAEHVQVIADNPDWYLENLQNYGSLFLGESCTVSYGDKTSGTNHILPTKKAARYSGGLNVGKFIKTLTYQKLTKEANRTIGAVASRISRYEGMEGHARTADIRLRKYYPDETFDFEVYEQKPYV